MEHKTMYFKNDRLYLIDQRQLPARVEYFTAEDYRGVKFAISEMVVRGAPAIGAAAAYGVYLAAREYVEEKPARFIEMIKKADKDLIKARPTAVNLKWAVDRMEAVLEENRGQTNQELLENLFAEAEAVAREDVEINKKMAENGNEIIPESAVILTHCNTGALATVDYGTALGVIREAHYTGKNIEVYADETRPRLQGARLTAFELEEEDIPAHLIADSTAATLIRDGVIDVILVGADRIAGNGDTANKIGTYMLSELARVHQVPFYIVAPTSTIDFAIDSGADIEIEERSREEIAYIQGKQVAPETIDVYNPAFDITPAANISGIITEKGIINPPLREGIEGLSSDY